ncbi:hypothetical protein M1D51_12550 [Arthrobacter sp. R3-55]
METERVLHLEVAAEYAALRKTQKTAGYRSPPGNEVTPIEPRRWHGDERLGVQYVLDSWRRLQRDQGLLNVGAGRTVLTAIEGVLGGAGLSACTIAELQAILDWSRWQIHAVGWQSDGSLYGTAWNVYRHLGQLYLLVEDVPAVGTPWNFRERETLARWPQIREINSRDH